MAAEQFLGGIVGRLPMCIALGAGTPIVDEVDARVRAAVDVFVRIYGAA